MGTVFQKRRTRCRSRRAWLPIKGTGQTPAVISPTDAGLFYSPYVWTFSSGVYAQTTHSGAYLRTRFSGTSCIINIAIPATAGARLAVSVDNGDWVYTDRNSSHTELEVATGLADTTHTMELVITVMSAAIDRWVTPVSRLRITGLTLDAGKMVSSPTDIQAGRCIIYCDSNGEGSQADAGSQDASLAFPLLIGRALGCEVGVCGFIGQGVETVGYGDVPTLVDSWDLHSQGVTRLSVGLFSPAPDFIVSTLGQNDGTTDISDSVEVLIGDWRAAAPGAKIAFCSPTALGAVAVFLEAGVDAADDADAHYVTTDEDFGLAGSGLKKWTYDVHLSQRGHARYAAILAAGIREATADGGGSGPVPMIGSPLIRSLQ